MQEQTSVFQVEIDDNRIAIVRILSEHNEANWLPLQFADELRQIIGTIIYQQARGVIFISARPKNFIQGIKVSLLKGKTDEQLQAFSQDAQAVMRELNVLKVPVIAAIDGNCFSLGLELALACDYRIATDETYTQFAMPQVRSGLLPFAGGTQRLPRLIGLQNATPLLLSGYKIGVEKAKKLGLVDKLVPANCLFDTAYQLLLENSVQKVDHKQPLTRFKKWRKQLEGNQCFRNKFLDRTENLVWSKTFGNYPAVATLINLLKEPHFKAGLALEQQALATLFNTETANVLIDLKKTDRKSVV